MIRHRLLVLAALAFFGCRSERTFEMKSEPTTAQMCKGPGNERYAGEQEVRLRYVRAPKYYEVFCSNALATLLKSGAKPTVPMVVRRNGGPGSSFSICEVAGVKANAPGTECTFEGHTAGGYDCIPARDGDCTTNKPNPWD